MIGGDVFTYVAAAYALTVASLVGLALAVFLRARHWAKQARALEEKR